MPTLSRSSEKYVNVLLFPILATAPSATLTNVAEVRQTKDGFALIEGLYCSCFRPSLPFSHRIGKKHNWKKRLRIAVRPWSHADSQFPSNRLYASFREGGLWDEKSALALVRLRLGDTAELPDKNREFPRHDPVDQSGHATRERRNA